MKDYNFKDLMSFMEKKLKRDGKISADGQITQKGWDELDKQWRAIKAKRPN